MKMIVAHPAFGYGNVSFFQLIDEVLHHIANVICVNIHGCMNILFLEGNLSMTNALTVAESHVRPFADESGVLGAEPLGVGVAEDLPWKEVPARWRA